MMAFAARYGHTDPSVTRHMPITELALFVEALSDLIGEESEAAKTAADD